MLIFERKRAAITGAASGIGLAVAQAFAAHGAELVLIDLKEDKLEELIDALSTASGAAAPVPLACDVSSESSVAEAFRKVPSSIDILVNCAGIAQVGDLLSTTSADSGGGNSG